MKGLTLGIGLTLSLLAIGTGVAQAQTTVVGDMPGGLPFPAGEYEIAFNPATGLGVVKYLDAMSPGGDVGILCSGGTTDPPPALTLSGCKVFFSSLPLPPAAKYLFVVIDLKPALKVAKLKFCKGPIDCGGGLAKAAIVVSSITAE
jgi:hypothetical protein